MAVEADVSGGLPAFSIVGLPDSAVRESADRVRAAIKNLGFKFPDRRITVNLAPADVRKTGPVYDLPLLLAVLTASGQLEDVPEDAAFLGELALDGTLRPVSGVLPMALAAAENGIRALLPALAEKLEQEIRVFIQKNGGQVDNLSLIYEEIHKKHSSFDIKDYGYSRLSSFLRSIRSLSVSGNSVSIREKK